MQRRVLCGLHGTPYLLCTMYFGKAAATTAGTSEIQFGLTFCTHNALTSESETETVKQHEKTKPEKNAEEVMTKTGAETADRRPIHYAFFFFSVSLAVCIIVSLQFSHYFVISLCYYWCCSQFAADKSVSNLNSNVFFIAFFRILHVFCGRWMFLLHSFVGCVSLQDKQKGMQLNANGICAIERHPDLPVCPYWTALSYESKRFMLINLFALLTPLCVRACVCTRRREQWTFFPVFFVFRFYFNG